MTQAQQRWRAALGEVPDSAGWAEDLKARQLADDFVLHGEPAMRVAEPVFVPRSEMAADEAAVTAVLAGLQAAGAAVLHDAALGQRFASGWWADMPDPELFSLPAGYPQDFVLGRLDGVRTPDGLRFLEFNGGLPGGLLPGTEAAGYLAQTELAQQFAKHTPFELPRPAERAIDAVVAAWHGFGGSGDPYVVVALPEELRDLAGKQVRHLRGLAMARGVEMDVVDPGALVFADGRLRWDGWPVDVLVRAFFTPMFAYLGTRLDGILAALRAEAICMITSLQSGLFGLKSLFAMITDPAVPLDVPGEVRDRAMTALPWTRMLQPGSTTDDEGRTVDLPDYLLARREHLVIKPTAGYGGAGVELGWLHTEASWAKVVAAAMGGGRDGTAGGHIVQAKVPIADQEHPELALGFPLRAYTADHNPLICDGKLAGYFVRLAAAGGGVTNLSGGAGTITGVFVID